MSDTTPTDDQDVPNEADKSPEYNEEYAGVENQPGNKPADQEDSEDDGEE